MHIWDDNYWKDQITGFCDLKEIKDDIAEVNYVRLINGPINDICIPNEFYFTEFIPEVYSLKTKSLQVKSYIQTIDSFAYTKITFTQNVLDDFVDQLKGLSRNYIIRVYFENNIFWTQNLGYTADSM